MTTVELLQRCLCEAGDVETALLAYEHIVSSDVDIALAVSDCTPDDGWVTVPDSFLRPQPSAALAVSSQRPPDVVIHNHVAAPEVTVNVPRQPPPRVRVGTPIVNVSVPKQEPPNVTVNVPKQPRPRVRVDAPVVNVPKQDAPIVNVNIPEQKAPVVNIEVPRQDPPVVNVPKQDPPVVNVASPTVHVAAPHVTVEVPTSRKVSLKKSANGTWHGEVTEGE